MHNRRTLALMLAFALVPPSALPAPAKDAWQEEILLQLSELRKAQGELKQQVTELRAEVTALRAGAGGARPALDLRDSQLPSTGSADAQVAIVEFSDFQCPYCRKHAQGTWPQLREKYLDAGRARYFFVDYPLAFHPQARPAALAGACAHEQGAFWRCTICCSKTRAGSARICTRSWRPSSASTAANSRRALRTRRRSSASMRVRRSAIAPECRARPPF